MPFGQFSKQQLAYTKYFHQTHRKSRASVTPWQTENQSGAQSRWPVLEAWLPTYFLQSKVAGTLMIDSYSLGYFTLA